MSDTPHSAGTAIDVDLYCIHCGYNLRGLDESGQCPECGQAVAHSTAGDLLRFADPKWLGKIRLGVTLKLVSVVFGVLAGAVAGAIIAVLSAGSPGAGGAAEALAALVGIGGGLFGLWATFAITAQEPRVSLREDPVTLRKVIRFCAVAGFAGQLVQLSDPDAARLALHIVGVVPSLAGIVAAGGELFYLRRFALRMPNPALARSTRMLFWLVVIGFSLAAIVGGIAGAMMWNATPAGTAATPAAGGAFPGGASGVLIGFATCFGSLVGVVGFIWYLILLIRYRRRLGEVLAEAQGLYTNAPGPAA